LARMATDAMQRANGEHRLRDDLAEHEREVAA
jgi:hypothetical protein